MQPRNSRQLTIIALISTTFVILLTVIVVIITLSTKEELSEPTPKPTIIKELSNNTVSTQTQSKYKKLPKSFKGTPIPTSIYDRAYNKWWQIEDKKKETYVTDTIKKYYTYREILKSNNVPISQYPENPTFDEIEADWYKMQQYAQKELVSSTDFLYIIARYQGSSTRNEASAKFGDLKIKAKELIEKYRTLLDKPAVNVYYVMNLANTDKDLILINNNWKSEYIKNYTADQKKFYTDTGFHSFLFSQEENKVSKIYEIEDEKPFGKFAYLIIYPTRINNRVYMTLEEAYNKIQYLTK
ncbi:MAG: hypothetical protein WCO06_02530 [Candidatus Roizmanbacteria bacterium]